MNIYNTPVTGRNKEIIQSLYERVGTAVTSKPSSLAAFDQFFASVMTAFPDYKVEINSMVDRGDMVMVRYAISGTHQNEFMGLAPTQKPMIIRGLDVFRMDKGMIVQHWDAARQVNGVGA
jgi:predicted ester cyclase